MAWTFRKRVKIIPGVHLNFSKKGISTSIGVRGASVTFGRTGTYLNTSIPTLGIHNRERLSGSNSNPTPTQTRRNDNLNPNNSQPDINVSNNIESGDLESITSQDMQGIKETITLANNHRTDLENDILDIQKALTTNRAKLKFSYIFLYGVIFRQFSKKIKADIELQEEAIRQTREQIENCYVKLDIEFEPEIKEKYEKLVKAFKKLTISNKIWDVVSVYLQDTAITRSSASSVVERKEVRFSIKSIPDIRSNFETLCFENANGADLYFYPSFIVMHSDKKRFALIGFDEIMFAHNHVRFNESDLVPNDSIIIDKTWAKVNKNGTPDKRFKGNYQIPIVRYGEISLKTNTGLNKKYMFSNYEYSEIFGTAFYEYQHTIKSLKEI